MLNPIEGYLATSGPKVLLLRKIVWEIFNGSNSTFEIPEYSLKYINNPVFRESKYIEFFPPITFNTVPQWANWVAVYPEK